MRNPDSANRESAYKSSPSAIRFIPLATFLYAKANFRQTRSARLRINLPCCNPFYSFSNLFIRKCEILTARIARLCVQISPAAVHFIPLGIIFIRKCEILTTRIARLCINLPCRSPLHSFCNLFIHKSEFPTNEIARLRITLPCCSPLHSFRNYFYTQMRNPDSANCKTAYKSSLPQPTSFLL